MIAVPYQPEHLAALALQPAQANFVEHLPPDYAQWLRDNGGAFTFVADAGVVAIVGIAQEWEGRGQCWAMLSEALCPHMFHATRLIRRYLDLSPYRRIEAQTPQDFEQGKRWLALLGFEAEGPMKNYYPDGRTAIRYARIKP